MEHSARMVLRLSPELKARFEIAARAAGISVSKWLRTADSAALANKPIALYTQSRVRSLTTPAGCGTSDATSPSDVPPAVLPAGIPGVVVDE